MVIAFGVSHWFIGWTAATSRGAGKRGGQFSGRTSDITTDATKQRQESEATATLVRAAINAIVMASRALAIA